MQRAVVLLRHALRLKHGVLKLLSGISRVQDDEGHKEHPLVAALQILQQLFRLRAVGGQVGGEDVHVVPRANRFFLLVHFGFVQVGDFAFNLLDGRGLVDGLDVHGDDEGAFDVEKIRQHAVVEFRGEDLQDAGRAPLVAHAEAAAFPKGKGGRRDEILRGQTGQRQPVPLEAEGFPRVHVEDVVHQAKARFPVQCFGGNAKPLEVIQDVQFKALQAWLGDFDAVRFDAESQEFGFDQSVVSLCHLVLEHPRVLVANPFKAFPPPRDADGPLKTFRARSEIEKGKLNVNGAVEVVEEIAPAARRWRFSHRFGRADS